MVPPPPYPAGPADLETKLDDKSRPLGACQVARNKPAVELGTLMKQTSAPGPSTIDTDEALNKTNLVIGPFGIGKIHSGRQLTQQENQTVHFTKKYATIPGLVVGFTLIDISLDVDMRAKVNFSEIQRDQFQITLDNWHHTNYRYRATVHTWRLKLGIRISNTEATTRVRTTTAKTSAVHNTRQITFKCAYEAPPKCVKSFATDLTTTGFTIHIVTGSETKLSSEMASWIAYPADRLGVASGSFSSLGTQTWMTAQVYNRGFEPFGSGVFDKPLRGFLALNALDTSRKQGMRLLVKADNVSAAGMAWHLDTWADTTLYSAGASYIAFS